MTQPGSRPIEERVLVLAPTTADAALTRTLLAEAGFGCSVCPDLAALCREFVEGAGVLLLTEEVLADGEADGLVEMLRQEPPWSDVPILLLAGSGADSPVAVWAMDLLGNVTVLERPVRVTTLVSGLRAALRARRRQYELRRRVEAMRTQGERLRLLWEAASVLLSMDRPDAMMRGLFAKIAPHLGLDAYFNFMVDEASDALRMESCLGISDEEARKIARLEFGEAICGAVALHRRPITATSIQQSDEPRVQLVKSYGIRVYACSPLMAGDRLLGTLSFASRSRDEFDADELEFLETICHYVAFAYERVRLIRQLREEDRKKDEFLAMLAHELRNPLAPIRNGLQVMRLAGDDRGAMEEARTLMERQVTHMVRLIDDLLDVSRITRGKLELRKERIELSAVVGRALEACAPIIRQSGHELTVTLPDGPLYVDADNIRLAQVLGNLLSNAAKYSDRGGRIWLTVARQGDEAVVSVRDTGVGIPDHMLPKVFDMFTQVDRSLEKSHGGLGIGLSIVKRLVEMHGGTVKARSEGHGMGSEFIIRLPVVLSTVHEQAGREDGRRAGPTVRRRILVVDDNEDAASSLAMMLTVMGNEVRIAHDGAEGVTAAAAYRPDMIVLDIGMPRLNGFDACRRIREQPWGKDISIVALTGWGHEDDKRRSHEAGFDHHLVKPVEPSVLEGLLESVTLRRAESMPGHAVPASGAGRPAGAGPAAGMSPERGRHPADDGA